MKEKSTNLILAKRVVTSWWTVLVKEDPADFTKLSMLHDVLNEEPEKLLKHYVQIRDLLNKAIEEIENGKEDQNNSRDNLR